MAGTRPKWLVSLESAVDGQELLATIPNAEEAALQGLFRRHGLDDPGLQLDRARVIEERLAEGTLTFQDLFDWREDVLAAESAIDGIQDFRQRHPLIDRFRREHDLDGGRDEVVLDAILKELWRGTFPLQEWVEFLDERREETDRHLFLFRLPSGNLKTPTPTSGFIWKTHQPVLVNLTGDPDEQLKLEWVGWRKDPSAAGKGRRSLTFARVDLRRRKMELQLQLMRKGGTSALTEERDVYVREVARLLQVQPEQLHLEPAIRSMLKNKRLTLESWMVRTPKGGHLRSKGEPGLFERLQLGLLRFYALELKGDWKVSEKVAATVWMNARTDAIDIRTQCEPAVLAELIATVSRYIEEEPQGSSSGELKTSATIDDGTTEGTTGTEADGSTNGGLDARVKRRGRKVLLEKVVDYHRRLGEDVDISHPRLQSTKDLLFNAKTLQEAISEFGVLYLGVTFYILCPPTGNPVRVAGRITQYETLEKIPESVDCENGDEAHSHQTKGNIWLKVGPEQTMNGKPPKWIFMIFALIFAMSFAALSWFFASLLKAYPQQKWFILSTWPFAALALVVAIRWLWGRSAFEGAANWIRTLAETSVSKRAAASDGDGSGSADHD